LDKKLAMIKELRIFAVLKEIPSYFKKSTLGDGTCGQRIVFQIEKKALDPNFKEGNDNDYIQNFKKLDANLRGKTSRSEFVLFLDKKITSLQNDKENNDKISLVNKLTEIRKIIVESPTNRASFANTFLQLHDLWLLYDELNYVLNADYVMYKVFDENFGERLIDFDKTVVDEILFDKTRSEWSYIVEHTSIIIKKCTLITI